MIHGNTTCKYLPSHLLIVNCWDVQHLKQLYHKIKLANILHWLPLQITIVQFSFVKYFCLTIFHLFGNCTFLILAFPTLTKPAIHLWTIICSSVCLCIYVNKSQLRSVCPALFVHTSLFKEFSAEAPILFGFRILSMQDDFGLLYWNSYTFIFPNNPSNLFQ